MATKFRFNPDFDERFLLLIGFSLLCFDSLAHEYSDNFEGFPSIRDEFVCLSLMNLVAGDDMYYVEFAREGLESTFGFLTKDFDRRKEVSSADPLELLA